ncbi:MAG: amidohydrolase family protein [Acidobacteria bacterium]|nr:amidohydrolase family protein [Acidobacteriota bacterium]
MAAAAGLAACRPAADEAFLIRDVTIVDGRESTPLSGMSVLVEGNRIASVGPVGSLRPPPGTRVFEAGGLYLAPGLWDMHTHALWEPFVSDGSLALFVANGVTGIRDMGGELEVLRRLKAPGRERGEAEPRIVASGPWLNVEELDSRAGMAVVTPAEALRAVAAIAEAGADFIKVYLQLPREVFLAVLQEAAARGLPVAGHVPIEVGAQKAAELGMRSIEHMQAEIGGYCNPEETGDCVSLFETFRRLRTWQTPTLVVRRNRAHLEDPAVVEAPGLEFAPAYLREEWEAVRTLRLESMDAEELDAVRGRFAAEGRLAAALIRAGVPILAGSDAGDLYCLAGFSLHEELALLVEAGMSAREALRTATLGAAEYLGLEDSLGTVEAGKLADLILLEADPSENIANARRLRAVVLGGRLFDRPALDRLLSAPDSVELRGSREPEE